jgi:hypothetical protein
LDFTIKPIAELSKLEFDRIIITTIDSKEDIFNRLLKERIPRQKIVSIE